MEELGLHITFEEIKIRGTNDVRCLVRAIEEGTGGIEVQDQIYCKSWEKLKEEFPTFSDILKHFFQTDYWSAGWRDGDRLIYAETVQGHEGLYEHDPLNPVRIEWNEI